MEEARCRISYNSRIWVCEDKDCLCCKQEGMGLEFFTTATSAAAVQMLTLWVNTKNVCCGEEPRTTLARSFGLFSFYKQSRESRKVKSLEEEKLSGLYMEEQSVYCVVFLYSLVYICQ